MWKAAFGSVPAQVVPGDHGVHPRVPLPDVGDAGGPIGMAGEAEVAGIDHVGQRVISGVPAGGNPLVLLGRMAGARLAARDGLVRMGGVGEEEVDGVLRAVEERAAVGLGREPLPGVRVLPEGIGLSLALRVEGHHHVAVLGERLGGVPVHLLVGLHRAVGDDDAGAPSGTRPGGPDMAGDGRAVAGGEQNRLDDPVAVRAPVVEADVAGASVLPVAQRLPMKFRCGSRACASVALRRFCTEIVRSFA